MIFDDVTNVGSQKRAVWFLEMAPGKNFPVGDYRVEIYLIDKPDQAVKFKVTEWRAKRPGKGMAPRAGSKVNRLSLYYQARDYEDKIGRFLQADPLIPNLYNPQNGRSLCRE